MRSRWWLQPAGQKAWQKDRQHLLIWVLREGWSSGSCITLALEHKAALGLCAPGGPGLLIDIWEGFRDQGEA